MMTLILMALGSFALLIWLYLLLAHHGFWREGPNLARGDAGLPEWPDILVIVPARDEAAVIEEGVRSLLGQDYPGRLDVIVVDDRSSDGTGDIVQALVAEAGPNRHLQRYRNGPRPRGWSGKIWAIQNGMEHAKTIGLKAPFLLLTDADIAHDRGSVAALLEKMVNDDRDLVSLMVRLRAKSFWERLLIPPFVFFFQMLYPFRAVNDPRSPIAAAAGGCVLVRQEALADAGGIAAIKGDLIDDVALGKVIKRRAHGRGRIWLGLTGKTMSLRAYETFGSIWQMVVRTADTQLSHSILMLTLAIAGMALIYLLPPLLLLSWPIHQSLSLVGLGLASWGAMSLSFRSTLTLYQQPWPWLLTLPIAAFLYALMTLGSAIQYRRGLGGLWKGRVFVE